MGFLFYAIKLPKFITVSFFLNLISHAHYLFIASLTHLRLYKHSPPQESPDSGSTTSNYILVLDSSSPSLVPIPVHVVTAAIKNRVPVIEYEEFVRGGGEKGCSICLECIDGRDEIRELCNCRHLFHRECLDTWIDEGRVTCPLCRSMLLPPRVNPNQHS
ncbi:probable E3 ubiquitin-protein ligase XERICO [Salvia splendens]|uniref:probable E3 ubiquitin-protein ligase XERICO n=1 Tax=Salvia splendens TaxID=180675 RepID=UPI001C25D447|nr:probable E3 ubiquitin-protein ligase XERICO [Salvia splendens]XP_042005684.1 probable E3 ubiquitin-protein ligase XERICO [Salvia splendens]